PGKGLLCLKSSCPVLREVGFRGSDIWTVNHGESIPGAYFVPNSRKKLLDPARHRRGQAGDTVFIVSDDPRRANDRSEAIGFDLDNLDGVHLLRTKRNALVGGTRRGYGLSF